MMPEYWKEMPMLELRGGEKGQMWWMAPLHGKLYQASPCLKWLLTIPHATLFCLTSIALLRWSFPASWNARRKSHGSFRNILSRRNRKQRIYCMQCFLST